MSETGMWTGAQLDFSLRVTTIVVPLAMYFLILGLLNSRRHPQVLSGKVDFALLLGALGPLFLTPVLNWIGFTASSLILGGAALAAGIVLLAPRGQVWVVYNASARQTRQAVARAIEAIGLTWRVEGGLYQLSDGESSVQVQSFAMLRNVSVRFTGSEDLGRRFAACMGASLEGLAVETSPMASAMLLVATGMMMAPLALMANQSGEIVRLLTGLFN